MHDHEIVNALPWIAVMDRAGKVIYSGKSDRSAAEVLVPTTRFARGVTKEEAIERVRQAR